MSVIETQHHAAEIRNRLRFPPNAVPDLGIDLKRKPEPPKKTAQVIQIAQHWPEATPIPVVTVPEPPAEVVLIPTEATIEARVVYPKISMIMQEVAMFYPVSVIDILSSRRSADQVRPRHIAMYLAKELTLRSLPEIGRQMGGRDHTTVLHGHRKIKAALETDERLRDEIEVLKLRIADRVVAASRINPEETPCNSTPNPTSTAP